MPYTRYAKKKRTYTRATKKPKAPTRRYRPKRYPRTSNAAVSGTLSTTYQKGYTPFGQAYFVRLPYASNQRTLTATPGVITAFTYNFSLCSMHDPDVSGTGHQPYCYDQMMTLYSYYQVYGVKYEITFTDPTADGVIVGVSIRRTLDATHDPSGKTVSFLKETKLGSMSPLNNSGKQTKKFTGYMALHKLFGITKKEFMADKDYGASLNYDPYHGSLIQPFFIDPSGNGESVKYDIKMTYYARLSQYKTPGQS